MTNEKAIIILNSLKQYYNDKNEDSYVGFDDEEMMRTMKQLIWLSRH